MAADSLRRLAGVLAAAAPALMEALAGCTDVPDQHAPEVFFQTVKAASDVGACPPPAPASSYRDARLPPHRPQIAGLHRCQ